MRDYNKYDIIGAMVCCGILMIAMIGCGALLLVLSWMNNIKEMTFPLFMIAFIIGYVLAKSFFGFIGNLMALINGDYVK